MVLTASSVLIIIACIIFGVGFGVLIMAEPTGKTLWELIFLGSTFFAAGHVIP